MTPLIELKHINAGYDRSVILRDVNLSVFSNDFIGVIGPNGGGKTTLIKVILNLLTPFGGKVLRAPEMRAGYLPQINSIDKRFPITVEDVILTGSSIKGFSSREEKNARRKRIDELLDLVGLKNTNKTAIGELSGGQMQRVFLSRALYDDPNVLILDEPNTYVDKSFEENMYNVLGELNRKMAILLVTHDVGTIIPLVKTIACVNGGLHYHPSNKITTDILKSYNCPIEIISHGTVPHRVLTDHNHE